MAQGGIPPGETDFGTPQSRGGVGVIADQRGTGAGAGLQLPGYIHLQNTNITTNVVVDFYIWVDDTGDLRGLRGSVPVNQNTDGVVLSATPMV